MALNWLSSLMGTNCESAGQHFFENITFDKTKMRKNYFDESTAKPSAAIQQQRGNAANTVSTNSKHAGLFIIITFIANFSTCHVPCRSQQPSLACGGFNSKECVMGGSCHFQVNSGVLSSVPPVHDRYRMNTVTRVKLGVCVFIPKQSRVVYRHKYTHTLVYVLYMY